MIGLKLFKWINLSGNDFLTELGMDVFLLLIHMYVRQFTAGPPYTWHQDVCIYQ